MLMNLVSQTLEACLARGMTVPLHIVTIASNGTLIVFRVTDDGTGRTESAVVCEHPKNATMLTTPITITLIGSNGDVDSMRVEPGDDSVVAFQA